MTPCPFCGCDETVYVWNRSERLIETVRVHCTNCDASGPCIEVSANPPDDVCRDAAEAATTLWNKRDLTGNRRDRDGRRGFSGPVPIEVANAAS